MPLKGQCHGEYRKLTSSEQLKDTVHALLILCVCMCGVIIIIFYYWVSHNQLYVKPGLNWCTYTKLVYMQLI